MAPKSDLENEQQEAQETSPLLEQPRTKRTKLSSSSSSLLQDETEELSKDVWTRTISELQQQWDTALPTLQSLVITKIPWLISLRFVGGIGAEELAAAALATTLCNVTGMSLSVGLSSALTTLAGQAKGEIFSRVLLGKENESNDIGNPNNNTIVSDEKQSYTNDVDGDDDDDDDDDTNDVNTPLLFFYRGMLVQLALVIPVGVWWLFGTKDFLLFLGQSEQLSSMTEDYLKVLAIALWGYSINWTISAWVQTIGMADIPAQAAFLGFALHVPLNWFFIYYLNWGYLGCAVATSCFQIVQPIYMMIQLFIVPSGRRRTLECTGGTILGHTDLSFWKEFAIASSSLNGCVQYLSLGVPGIVIISEWWASEIAIFLAGRLQPYPDAALGGMSLYQSINTFCFMFPAAISIAGSARVGNLLGAGRPEAAKFAAKMSVFIAVTFGTTLGMMLLVIPHSYIPSLFAPNEDDVIYQTSRTIPLLAFYVIADSIQVSLSGIIKGAGRQCITMPIVLVAYWMVALPLAYHLAFTVYDGEMFCENDDENGSFFHHLFHPCGTVGLVTGMTTGTWCHMLLMAIVVGGTMNWNAEAKRARERVSNKSP